MDDPDLIAVTEDGDEIRHAWYQWVAFVLVLQVLAIYLSPSPVNYNAQAPIYRFPFLVNYNSQAALCYIPHALWKNWEGGKLFLLLQVLDWRFSIADFEKENDDFSQGLDQMSLEGVEGTKEKRAKIVTYVVNNLRR